jgi:hypothetical protein
VRRQRHAGRFEAVNYRVDESIGRGETGILGDVVEPDLLEVLLGEAG